MSTAARDGAGWAVLELIGTPGHETVSCPNPYAARIIADLRTRCVAPVVAEIGIGIGATSLAMATALDHRGELHLFDLEPKVRALTDDLAMVGFANVHGQGNTDRHWDSYNWTLGRILLDGVGRVFDYIYLDGARTFGIDALAFFLCDRLLKPGGLIEFDDCGWSWGATNHMADTRDQFMTAEQAATPQVAMVVDVCLRGNREYRPLIENRLFQRRS